MPKMKELVQIESILRGEALAPHDRIPRRVPYMPRSPDMPDREAAVHAQGNWGEG